MPERERNMGRRRAGRNDRGGGGTTGDGCISVGNTGDATWLSTPSIAPGAAAARTENAKGAVFLSSVKGSDVSCSLPIDRDVPFGGDVEWKDVILIDRATKPAAVVLRMEARDRAAFGEILRFRVSPK